MVAPWVLLSTDTLVLMSVPDAPKVDPTVLVVAVEDAQPATASAALRRTIASNPVAVFVATPVGVRSLSLVRSVAGGLQDSGLTVGGRLGREGPLP